MPNRLDPVSAVIAPIASGPSTPPKRLNTLNSPKNSPERSGGTRLAYSERLSACAPPCTVATRIASIQKSRSVRSPYAIALMTP